MATRANIYEKYKKSDIFNLNSSSNNSVPPNICNSRNFESSVFKADKENFHTIEHSNPRKYNYKQHESDIFNINNNSFQASVNPNPKKNRGAHNNSTCFDSMKDNAQYSRDIKEYSLKYRTAKTDYDPEKYLHHEDATERLYNQLYEKKRNPIFSNTKDNSMQNKDKNNETSDKNTFIQRKKNVGNNFTKAFFNQRNFNDKKRLEQETEQALKAKKFYKSKGFTYCDNENNNLGEKKMRKFVTSDKNLAETSKINKQIQLQSNIFGTNDNKVSGDGDDIEQIKKRIKNTKEKKDEEKPKNIIEKKNLNNRDEKENNKNIWGTLHSNWERSNLDWRNTDTEIIFNKTYSGKKSSEEKKENENEENKNEIAFQRKMNQLQDSGNKDTINESIKSKRKYNKNTYKEKLNNSTNLEKIEEILDQIPENMLKYDKKKKIKFNANSTGLNGEEVIDENIVNYNKYLKKNTLKKQGKKEPTIKIMSKDGEKNKKKNLDKNFNNLKNHDSYNIHDFILSYDSNAKNSKNNFDKFSDKDIKLLFSKKGIHAYDIQRKQFDNGKYNAIKFKVRENEGENSLKEKMKEIENDFINNKYKICIEKDVEKEKKKNLRGVANIPGSKVSMFVENESQNKKKKEPMQIKNNTKFTGQFNMIDHKYKK